MREHMHSIYVYRMYILLVVLICVCEHARALIYEYAQMDAFTSVHAHTVCVCLSLYGSIMYYVHEHVLYYVQVLCGQVLHTAHVCGALICCEHKIIKFSHRDDPIPRLKT